MSFASIVIAIIVALLLLLYVIIIYNKMVTLRNRFLSAFAQIEVQLKRRYDLIPNLVEAAKAYLSHERETLEAIVAARNTALAGLQAASAQPGNPSAMSHLGQAEGSLASAMGHLNVTMEAYPDLKASQNMVQLNEELTSTENKVAFSRQAFNDAVMTYNTYRQSFPQVLLANLFGHNADASFLVFADSIQIQDAPKVMFS
ncbi:LemA family protein [Pseudomonas sp. OV226]|uniref:LemA family protein n=1 Tax=Pseudomonas sp. OV226 TaxID=2135588 RepID=UPI000D6CF98A|nr:LemA family protein [Pseudomonas sp. OV226]PWK30238.1 LemA protein [Pseudomonas sp. OV226]